MNNTWKILLRNDMTIFKIASLCHVESSKYKNLWQWTCSYLRCIPIQNLTEFRQSAAKQSWTRVTFLHLTRPDPTQQICVKSELDPSRVESRFYTNLAPVTLMDHQTIRDVICTQIKTRAKYDQNYATTNFWNISSKRHHLGEHLS